MAISTADREYLSALHLYCLCHTGPTPWSVRLNSHIAGPFQKILYICKVYKPWFCSPPTWFSFKRLSRDADSRVGSFTYLIYLYLIHGSQLSTGARVAEIKSHHQEGFVPPNDLFTNSAPLGRVGHRVTLSVWMCVCLRHRVQFFPRPLIGPEITWSVPDLSLVLPPLETWRLGNSITRKLGNSETRKPPPKNIYIN